LSDSFDDLFANGDLEPEQKGGKPPPLGLVVAPRARTKQEVGYDELTAEAQAYLAQVRRYGPFTPTFEEEEEP
jgi:hypothetical protein